MRTKLLAALFVPRRYGGGFNRYPLQKKFLQEWLAERSLREIAILDAACGSGEGVYALAALAADAGFHPGMGHIVPDRLFWAQTDTDDTDDEDGEAASADPDPSLPSFELPTNGTKH